MTDETSKPSESPEQAEPEQMDKTPQQEPDPSSVVETAEAESTASSSLQPQSVIHSHAAPSRSGVIALMLSLLAFVAVIGASAGGYLFSQNLQQQSFAATQDLSAIKQQLAEVRIDSKGRNQWFDGMSERSNKLDRQIESVQQLQTQDQAHLSKLDDAVGKLAAQVQGGRQAWQRAEIEHLLLVAYTRLQLQKDVHGAQIALKLAEERLQSLADPAYFSVREAIIRELARLAAVQLPDVQALALKLASLTDQVDALPTRQTHRGNFDTQLTLSAGPETLPWHQRLWVSLNEAVGSLVSVRRDVERREALLPPEQGFYLRQNLRLQLESARLALLREDNANFQAALRQADEWLQHYFDTQHAASKAALSSINKLANQPISTVLPDISGSLKALRSVGQDT
ncbi:MAG: uroporphyrinogen-III C-methyltransferase [Oceanococcus sp.]